MIHNNIENQKKSTKTTHFIFVNYDILLFLHGKTRIYYKMDAKKLINFKNLSILVTGSGQKIRRSNPPKKYIKDVELLENLLNAWINHVKCK